MENCKPELFAPFLEIYPSEFKRRIYLENFLYFMFDQDLIDTVNENCESSGEYFENLFVRYHFKHFAYELTEHSCRVIASFVSYLGTNGGQQYFSDVERFKQLPDTPRFYAYELAWSYQNIRKHGHDLGYRAIEYLLNTVENHPGPSENYFGKGYYDPTVEDYEIIDYVCKWLASTTGQEYLQKCKQDVLQEQEKRAENEFKRNC